MGNTNRFPAWQPNRTFTMHPMLIQAAEPPAERLFSVEEYYEMARAGILRPEERVELLEGRIVPMSPIGSRHAACVDALMRTFHGTCPDDVLIRVQGPVRLHERSEPEPDVSLLRAGQPYAERHPGPEDVLLLIEVADSSLERDRQEKRPQYARAGIPELWIVDLAARRLEVYRDPEGSCYRSVRQLRTGTVSPFLAADMRVELSDLTW